MEVKCEVFMAGWSVWGLVKGDKMEIMKDEREGSRVCVRTKRMKVI